MDLSESDPVLYLFQMHQWIPRVPEGSRRSIVNLDAWEETPSQYLGLPSDTLLQKAMNAIYDDNGWGYDWLTSQLKRLYIQYVFSGPLFIRPHNRIHR